MIIRRLLANLIDIFVFIAAIVAAMLYVLPFLMNLFGMEENNIALALGILVLVIAVVCLLQYPFVVNHQTIGKAFFGLRVVTTNISRPLTASIVVQREIFAKVMTCYFMCVPVFFGREGFHEISTETAIEKS